MNRKLRRALKAVGLGKSPQDAGSLRTEYAQACAEAGELQYKIAEFQRSLQELNDRIRKLNVAYSEALTEQKARASLPKEAGTPSVPASPPSEEK